jgi:hypothetical protein
VICGACGQDRHPVIEGDQNGRFQYTCGNGECHAFIKLHERSEPEAHAPSVQSVSVPAVVAPTPGRSAPIAVDTVDAAVAAIVTRLAEVDAALDAVPALKAEQKKLRRMLAASQAKPAKSLAVRNAVTGQVLGYSLQPKAHQ